MGVILGITKKQHYVSQGILKHFADEQKKTYELFIEKNLVSKKSIEDTMSQNYVYEHPKIETNTIEDVYEPYLIQLGFIARTPRGRICTPNAYKHLNIPYTGNNAFVTAPSEEE